MMFGPWHGGDNKGGTEHPIEYDAAPLIGYRSWLITPSLKLRSLHIAYEWTAGINEAGCHNRGQPHAGEASPHLECACGLYAALGEHPISEWDSMKQGRVSASGTIRMWGRVVECERGYKTQYADIESPVIIDATCLYHCEMTPTRVEVGRDTVWSYCDEHVNDREGTVWFEVDVWLRRAAEAIETRYGVETLSWVI